MATPKIIETCRDIEGWRPTGNESDGEANRRAFDRDKYLEVRDTMAKLVDLTNTMGCETQVIAGIVAGLLESHRYLQDKAIQAIFRALGEYGRLPGQYTDARNEFAHKLCSLLTERFRDELYWKD